MGLLALPINNANGQPVNVGVNSVTINGVTYLFEAVGIADPATGLTLNITVPGTRGAAAAVIQGDPSGVAVPVSLAGNGSTTPSVTSVTVTTTTTTLMNARSTRLGFIVYNEGPGIIYLAYGTVASIAGGYTVQIGPGASPYVDELPYRGAVSAIIGGTSSPSVVQITELTP